MNRRIFIFLCILTLFTSYNKSLLAQTSMVKNKNVENFRKKNKSIETGDITILNSFIAQAAKNTGFANARQTEIEEHT